MRKLKLLILTFIFILTLNSCVSTDLYSYEKTNYFLCSSKEDIVITDSNDSIVLIIPSGNEFIAEKRNPSNLGWYVRYGDLVSGIQKIKFKRKQQLYESDLSYIKFSNTKGYNFINYSPPKRKYSFWESLFGTSFSSSGDVYVKGYHRKNGTYVKPHTRSKPKR